MAAISSLILVHGCSREAPARSEGRKPNASNAVVESGQVERSNYADTLPKLGGLAYYGVRKSAVPVTKSSLKAGIEAITAR